MSEDRPLLETVLAMATASVNRTSLNDRELMIARVAALAAIGARSASYLLNIETANIANVAGLTLEDAQGTLIGVASIIGTARTVSAATAIAEALGLALAIEDALEERQASS